MGEETSLATQLDGQVKFQNLWKADGHLWFFGDSDAIRP
jgi:hypothetical protein